MARKKKLTGQRRSTAVEMVLRGETLKNVAKVFKCSPTAVRTAVMTSKPEDPWKFYQLVRDGRCVWCGDEVIGTCCLQCEIDNTLF